MDRIPTLQDVLLVLQTIAIVGLIARLLLAKLHKVYPFFFSYLVLVLLQSAVLAPVPYNSLFYRYAWVASEILIVCLQALIVLEMYSAVLRDLGGFANLARRYIKVTLGIAVVISLLLLGLEKTPKGPVGVTFIFERVVVLALVILVLLITVFLVYYPVPLNKNVIVYSIGFTIYLLTKAAARLVQNARWRWYGEINTLLVVVPTACLVYWMLALNQSGERKTVVIGHRWKREDEDRLLSQLKEINASLLRAARK